MAKTPEKKQAHLLRRKGESIKDIAKELGVSKSAVSLWCREITLTKEQSENLKEKQIAGGHRGRVLGARMNREKRMKMIREEAKRAQEIVGKLSKRDLLIAGIALYWAEGSKSDSTRRFIFINSDPKMVFLMKKFLDEVMDISDSELSLTIQINEIHKPRIKRVKNFWKNLLAIPDRQFTNTYYVKVKPKKEYENYDNYFGILRLQVLKSTRLQCRMLKLIEQVSTMPG